MKTGCLKIFTNSWLFWFSLLPSCWGTWKSSQIIGLFFFFFFFCCMICPIFCTALEHSVHSTSSDFCFFALAVLVCFVSMELLVVRSNSFWCSWVFPAFTYLFHCLLTNSHVPFWSFLCIVTVSRQFVSEICWCILWKFFGVFYGVLLCDLCFLGLTWSCCFLFSFFPFSCVCVCVCVSKMMLLVYYLRSRQEDFSVCISCIFSVFILPPPPPPVTSPPTSHFSFWNIFMDVSALSVQTAFYTSNLENCLFK